MEKLKMNNDQNQDLVQSLKKSTTEAEKLIRELDFEHSPIKKADGTSSAKKLFNKGTDSNKMISKIAHTISGRFNSKKEPQSQANQGANLSINRAKTGNQFGSHKREDSLGRKVSESKDNSKQEIVIETPPAEAAFEKKMPPALRGQMNRSKRTTGETNYKKPSKPTTITITNQDKNDTSVNDSRVEDANKTQTQQSEKVRRQSANKRKEVQPLFGALPKTSAIPKTTPKGGGVNLNKGFGSLFNKKK